MAADDIRAMSELLAADPSSLVFLQLGEALRRRGDLEVAARVAARGVERHPQLPDAHDLLARISADRGELERAIAEWQAVLHYQPLHAGARKGLGFVCFQLGRLEEASAHLGAALAATPDDATLAAALDTVHTAMARRSEAMERPTIPVRRAELAASETEPATLSPEPMHPAAGRPTMGLPAHLADPRADAGALFDDLLEGQRSAAMLLDGDGLVLAGRYVSADGRDLAADIGAQLSGVSDEAARAMRHLGMGAWRQIVFETEAASVAMAPSQDGVLLVAAARPIPLGFVRRVLERGLDRARAWVEASR